MLGPQLEEALNDSGKTTLTDDAPPRLVHGPAVTGHGGPDPRNRETAPHPPHGHVRNRPSARTAIPDSFLAGDYVRTDVDLATTEGANESARLAVNALLDADASDAGRREIEELFRPRRGNP